MKSLLKVAVAGLVFVFLSSSVALAQPVPGMVNVQGVLRNLYGEPVTGDYDVEFRLYDTMSGGAAFYTEPASTMTLVGGVFNTYLAAPVATIQGKTNVYLGVRVKLATSGVWETELPRTQVTSVAYAYKAGSASMADVAALANDLSCSGCVSSGDVGFNYAGSTSAGGPATSLSCTGCIATGHILNGTILKEDLNASIAYETTNTMTATQFIDKDNSAYYLDPSGTSIVSGMDANTIRYRTSVVYAPGGNPSNVGLIGEHFVAASLNNSGGVLSIGAGYGGGACGSVQVFGNACTGARIMTVLGDVSANRLVDVNNTNFYADPASTSMVNTMYFSATASTTTGSYMNLSGANRIMGGTQAFDSDWTDYNDAAYKLNPNATTRFNQFQTNGVQLLGMPGTGAFTGFAGLGTSGGHLYIGPNAAASDYVIMRHNATDRIYFNLNGVVNTGRPSLRTNGGYLAVSSGSTVSNLSGLGNARELLLQGNQADNSGTRTIVYGNIYSNEYWGRGAVALNCKVAPNGTSSVNALNATTVSGTVATFTNLKAGTISLQGGQIEPATHLTGMIGTNTNQWLHGYVYYMHSASYGTYSSRSTKREINYLDDQQIAGVSEILEAFKPVTFYYNHESKPDEVADGQDIDQELIRKVPHWGLILEEMPDFMATNTGAGWSLNDSVGFLLVAAKYQEDKSRALKRQLVDLEDRVAMLEQIMVDAGLIQ